MDTQITVNGVLQTVSAASDTPLLYVLRNDLALNGPKFGCGLSQCGACTVLIDGRAMRSCVYPLSRVAERAFLDEQAGECAYCVNGMLMVSTALLSQNPSPTEADIRQALNGNLCRCGSHARFVRAVQRAAGTAA
jgi:nicotinate dehydrogenase subunit A